MTVKRLAVLAAALSMLSVGLPLPNAEACTRMFWNTNGKVMLVGRSMDLHVDEKPVFYVFPRGIRKYGGVHDHSARWTSQYGSLVVTGFASAQVTWEGINTSGLAFHGLYLGSSKYEDRDPNRPGILHLRLGEYLLDNAASVSEALALMRQIQLVPELLYGSTVNNHYALEDATGDAAVVEFIGGQMQVYHGPQFTTLTNDPPLPQMPKLSDYRYFGGSLPLPGDVDPVSRFVRASAFLSTLDSAYRNPDPLYPKPTPVSAMFSAIGALAAPYGVTMPYKGTSMMGWPTLWTVVSDLTNKRVYFRYSLSRNNFWIDMKKLDFRKGAPIRLLEADKPGLAKEVSGRFRRR
jgi:choloylglycine hydrolase